MIIMASIWKLYSINMNIIFFQMFNHRKHWFIHTENNLYYDNKTVFNNFLVKKLEPLIKLFLLLNNYYN